MLLSLLPGVREFRTPLTVGLIYMMSAWVTFETRRPDWRNPALSNAIEEFAGTFGRPVVLAAISFAAYILGCLALTVLAEVAFTILVGARIFFPVTMRSFSTNRQFTIFNRFGALVFMTPIARRELDALLISKLTGQLFSDVFYGRDYRLGDAKHWASENPHRGLIEDVLRDIGDIGGGLKVDLERSLERAVNHTWFAISRELRQLKPQLLASSTDMYYEYDRSQAEYDFRANVGLSLLVAIAACSFAFTPWFLFGICAPVILFKAASDKLAEANGMLVSALVNGQLESASLALAERSWSDQISLYRHQGSADE
jgi:hypothetical protein